MNTIFGRKSFPAIENHESVGTENECYRLVSNEGLSRNRCHIRGRSQPRRAAYHGNGPDRGRPSREAQTLQSSRYLSDDGAALEFVDDRVGNVAVVPATGKASAI